MAESERARQAARKASQSPTPTDTVQRYPRHTITWARGANRDKIYKTDSLKHINWLKELENSSNWTHDPPSNDKIYPNMCNKMDGIYHKVKKQIAEKYNEITLIWNCSQNNKLKSWG